MKSFGIKPFLFPMPTYMINTYNEDGSVDSMMMAWGGICAENMVALNLEAEHKTVKNLKNRKAFTISVPGQSTLKECDYLGTASGNKVKNKFEKTGLTAIKSEIVDAPIVKEFPLTLECEIVEIQDQPYGPRFLGEIKNVLADESILNEQGNIDVKKINAFVFDQVSYDYFSIGDKIGKAWNSGKEFIKK